MKCQEVFDRIGFQEKINEDDSNEIEKYVCAIYGRKRLASVDEVRLELFLKKYKPKESKLISNMKKFDGSQLPPCSSVLKEKIKRTKYITGVWLSSVFLSPPDRSPLDYGWIIQHQKYQVKWFDGPQSPQSIDVIQAEREYDQEDIDTDEGITF